MLKKIVFVSLGFCIVDFAMVQWEESETHPKTSPSQKENPYFDSKKKIN